MTDSSRPSRSLAGVTVISFAALQLLVVNETLDGLKERPVADGVIVTPAVGRAVSSTRYCAVWPSVTASAVMSASSAAFRRLIPSSSLSVTVTETPLIAMPW